MIFQSIIRLDKKIPDFWLKVKSKSLEEIDAEEILLEIKTLEMYIQSLLVRHKFFRAKTFVFKD